MKGPPIILPFLIKKLDAIKAPTFNAMFNNLFLCFTVTSGSTTRSLAVAYPTVGHPYKKITITYVIDKLGDWRR